MEAILVTLVLAVLLTPACSYLGQRYAVQARPVPDRWHTGRTVPVLGGVAIFAAAMGTTATLLSWSFALTMCLAFLSGLVDDIYRLTPRVKLLLQASAVFPVALFAFPLEGPLSPILISTWLLLSMNTFNLLDNMDGTASATALAIGLGLALQTSWAETAIFPLILAAAAAGFLLYNTSPASIFMGDSGSLFLGAALGISGLLAVNEIGLLTLCIFLVPLTDTLFVVLRRIHAGRSIAQGGKDHLAHELFRLGMTERAIAEVYFWSTLAISVGVKLIAGAT